MATCKAGHVNMQGRKFMSTCKAESSCQHARQKVHGNMKGRKFMSTCKADVNKTSGYKRNRLKRL